MFEIYMTQGALMPLLHMLSSTCLRQASMHGSSSTRVAMPTWFGRFETVATDPLGF
jgi:hypothetical protein